jgi:hypothetical protein
MALFQTKKFLHSKRNNKIKRQTMNMAKKQQNKKANHEYGK